jgi:hypothetical protein
MQHVRVHMPLAGIPMRGMSRLTTAECVDRRFMCAIQGKECNIKPGSRATGQERFSIYFTWLQWAANDHERSIVFDRLPHAANGVNPLVRRAAVDEAHTRADPTAPSARSERSSFTPPTNARNAATPRSGPVYQFRHPGTCAKTPKPVRPSDKSLLAPSPPA